MIVGPDRRMVRWMTSNRMLLAACLALLLATTGAGCAVRSTTGAEVNLASAPESGESLAARCATYASRLELTRSQLQRRNTFGRLDTLRTRHREMEAFVTAHCG